MPKASSGGEKQAVGRALKERWWFGVAVLTLCMAVAWVVVPGLAHGVSPEGAKAIVAAKTLANSVFLEWLVALKSPFVQVFVSGLALKVFGVSDAVLFYTQFAWYALTVMLVYWLTHRQVRQPYALIITVLYALSPATLSACASMGPEMSFMAVSLMAVVSIDRYFGPKKTDLVSGGRLAWCGFWVVLSVLTSHWGYALALTYWLLVLRLFDLKKSLLVLLGMALALMPFYLWAGVYGANPLPTIQHTGWDQILSNTTIAILGTLKLQFAGLGEYDFSRWFWVRWMLGGFMALGLLLGLVRYSGVGSLYLVVSLIGVYGFLGVKNLFPVLPFLLLYLYFGLMRFGDWMKQLKLPVSKILSPVLTLLILVASASHWASGVATRATAPNGLYSQDYSGRKNDVPIAAMAVALDKTKKAPARIGRESVLQRASGTSVASATVEAENYDRAIRWMQLNTPDDASIGVSRLTRASAFQKVNRPLIIPPIVSSPEQLAERLLRYDFVLEQHPGDNTPISAAASMDAVTVLNRQRLRLVYHDPESRIRIWRVNKS